MKLREWARANNIHPETAYRWWRQGTLSAPTQGVASDMNSRRPRLARACWPNPAVTTVLVPTATDSAG
jgi:predicted site-specific integrase-resolvase